MYDATTEYHLNRAVESIKLSQQVHKRELAKKDETIQTLHKKIEVMQYETREFTDFKRLKEKENRELLSDNQYLGHELSVEKAENERLRDEVERLRSDLSAQEDKIAHLECEHDKANHIIKNLVKKLQIKPCQLPKTV